MYTNDHFGCIYCPIFFQDVSPTKSPSHVSQIKKRNNTEIKIHKTIKSIPYHSLHFHTFVSCEPIQIGFRDQDEDQDDDQEEYMQTNSQFILLKYNKLIFHYFNSFTSNKSNKYLSDIYISLLKSILLLVNKQIIHANVNQNNIIFVDETPMITDFSNACQPSDFEHEITTKNIDNLNLKIFEHFIIHYLIDCDLTSISISNIYDIINEYKIHNLLGDMNSKTLFLKSFINKPKTNIIQQLLMYYYTWDNFSISSIFLTLLNKNHCNTQNRFVLKWIEILETNMNANPLKRYTVEFTINKMEEIVYNAEINDLI